MNKRRATSPGEVIAAARAMIEADGVDGLSMRKLAAELGLAPTAIYWHVGDREQLLHAVFDDLLSELPAVRARGRSPRARVGSIARAIHRQVVSHATLVALAHALGRDAEVVAPGRVVLAREVAAAGVEGNAGERLVRSILFVIGGFVLLEHTVAPQPDIDALFEHTLNALLQPLAG